MSCGAAAGGAASAAAPDRCPRCGAGFACGMGGTAPCPCTTVQLTPATLQAVGARWQGCLCLRCLQALAAGAALEPGASPTV